MALVLVMLVYIYAIIGMEFFGNALSTHESEYFSDLWNVMDWVNYAIFFIVYSQVARRRLAERY